MIGGGSRKILEFAGAEADIVSLNFNNRAGMLGPDGMSSGLAGATAKKIDWIRSGAGYRFGTLVINADLFVPQSRPRLFVVGIHAGAEVAADLTAPGPIAPFHTPAVVRAVDRLPEDLRTSALWWNLPSPERRISTFADLIEDRPDSVAWHTPAETDRLLSLMSPINLAKVQAARRAGRRMVGGVYRRTRTDTAGTKAQRAEVRFDDVAGCLRTPSGGSSRQTLLVIDGPRTRSRLISARETARLMGLPDSYSLPHGYSDAYHLTGDGVVVPVARHLARYLFEPLVGAATVARAAA